MADTAIRFAIGGSLVALFAVLADAFKPKSFSGLFAAAPSVALGSLILATRSHGAAYATIEARCMAVGAVAFIAYASAVGRTLHMRGGRPWAVALSCLLVWVAVVGAGSTVWLMMK